MTFIENEYVLPECFVDDKGLPAGVPLMADILFRLRLRSDLLENDYIVDQVVLTCVDYSNCASRKPTSKTVVWRNFATKEVEFELESPTSRVKVYDHHRKTWAILLKDSFEYRNRIEGIIDGIVMSENESSKVAQLYNHGQFNEILGILKKSIRKDFFHALGEFPKDAIDKITDCVETLEAISWRLEDQGTKVLPENIAKNLENSLTALMSEAKMACETFKDVKIDPESKVKNKSFAEIKTGFTEIYIYAKPLSEVSIEEWDAARLSVVVSDLKARCSVLDFRIHKYIVGGIREKKGGVNYDTIFSFPKDFEAFAINALREKGYSSKFTGENNQPRLESLESFTREEQAGILKAFGRCDWDAGHLNVAVNRYKDSFASAKEGFRNKYNCIVTDYEFTYKHD